MKHSDSKITKKAVVLMWTLPLLLAVPNVALAVTGILAQWARAANVLLPLGVYIILMAAWKRTGRTAVCLLPLMVLAAFQIVLLFLYGDGSIIGVDMFLNVATTNSSEALELLGNLAPAILTVVALYLPPLIIGIVYWARRYEPEPAARRMALRGGLVLSALGVVSLLVSVISLPHYKIDEDLYPVNVLCNLGTSVSRAEAAKRYRDNCAGFSYGAVSERSDSCREVYIAVVGETSRADNWQLFGYGRFTTPRLCAIGDTALAACPLALSESNTTHKSVPLLLSTLTSREFSDSINHYKSVITAFREAGFHTDYISMQARNNSYIDYFGQEAHSTRFLREPEPKRPVRRLYDEAVLPVVDSVLSSGHRKQLIVIHLYGSHFNYFDRYPREQAYFMPDIATEAQRQNRAELINAYDNSIRQTDFVLSELIGRLDSLGCQGALVFTSDHGEDIFDDERGRFLHASPTPTYEQLHVPFLVYFNDALREAEPDKWHAALVNSRYRVSSSASFTPTLLDMAGITTPRSRESEALTSHSFKPVTEPLFLNDRNRAETLAEAGFREADFALLKASLQKR